MKNWQIRSEKELDQVAEELLASFPGKRIFGFYGEMGAGKTTFIKAICRHLGVQGQTSSPTFSIVNEYHADSSERIYHFDLYRLKNEQEAFDLGYEEYFYGGDWCLVEWPEKIRSLIPPGSVRVSLDVKDGKRHISASVQV